MTDNFNQKIMLFNSELFTFVSCAKAISGLFDATAQLTRRTDIRNEVHL